MTALYVLLISLAAGIILKRLGTLPAAASVLPSVITYFSLPALTFINARSLSFEASSLLPALMPWAQFILAACTFSILGNLRSWNRETITILILTCGLGNTSFLGFPILEALYGPEAIPIAVFADQLGSFLVLSTLGLALLKKTKGSQHHPWLLLRNVISFPPFLAFILGLLSRFYALPNSITEALSRIGSTLVPLAILYIGLQINWDTKALSKWKEFLGFGLSYKLIFFPCLTLLFCIVTQQKDGIATVTIIEAAMAPMISAGIITASFGFSPQLCTQILGLGIALSFATIPLWAWVLHVLGFIPP